MNKLKCKYIFNEQYNPKYINGAHGGITPQGEIVINFYLERNALPNSQTFQVDENKTAPTEIASEPSDLNNSFVRVIENGVIMNYKSAKEIHKWLGSHLERLEELTESK